MKVTRAIHRLDTLEPTHRDALIEELVALDDAVFRDHTPVHLLFVRQPRLYDLSASGDVPRPASHAPLRAVAGRALQLG